MDFSNIKKPVHHNKGNNHVLRRTLRHWNSFQDNPDTLARCVNNDINALISQIWDDFQLLPEEAQEKCIRMASDTLIHAGGAMKAFADRESQE